MNSCIFFQKQILYQFHSTCNVLLRNGDIYLSIAYRLIAYKSRVVHCCIPEQSFYFKLFFISYIKWNVFVLLCYYLFIYTNAGKITSFMNIPTVFFNTVFFMKLYISIWPGFGMVTLGRNKYINRFINHLKIFD